MNLPENGPAFKKATGTKLGRLSELISVAQRLVEERKLDFRPTFFAVVASNYECRQETVNEADG